MFNYTNAIVSCVAIVAIKVCYRVYHNIIGRYHRNIPFPHGQCDVDHAIPRRFIWKYRWERFLQRVFNRSPQHPLFLSNNIVFSITFNEWFYQVQEDVWDPPRLIEDTDNVAAGG